MHRAHESLIEPECFLQGQRAFGRVAPEPADQPQVGWRVDENGVVQPVPHRRMAEDENAFEHEQRSGCQRVRREASVSAIVVTGRLDGLAPAQGIEMGDEQRRIEGVRVIEVQLRMPCGFQPCVVLVIPVLRNHGRHAREFALEIVGEPRLARGRAPGNTDDQAGA